MQDDKISIEDIEKLLQPYVSLVSKYGADGKSTERVEKILTFLGKPQEKLKIIHIAGTSGKTSTAYYIAHLLSSSGLSVGLTVSPHVYSVLERVQILNKDFSEEDFLSEIKLFLKNIDEISFKPSYFEIFVAFSMWLFYKRKVDYVVLETGMGGLLDASNVARREDKVCVITDIGFDHMKVLGNSLAEIAHQKAGIIHQRNKVFMYKQSPEVMNQVTKRVDSFDAELNIVSPTEYTQKIATESQLSKYQYRNYILAKKTYDYCMKRDKKKTIESFDTKQVKIPARIETFKLKDGSSLIVDGAHNVQKMEAFVESFSLKYPNQKASVMIALKHEKDYKKIIDIIMPITNEIIVTNFVSSKNLPSHSVDPQILKKHIEENHISKVTAFADPQVAVKHHLRRKHSLRIITGSFYLISQVRNAVMNSL